MFFKFLILISLLLSLKANHEQEVISLLKKLLEKDNPVINVIVTNRNYLHGPIVDVKTQTPSFMEKRKKTYSTFKTFLAQNKYKTIFVSASTAYLFLLYKIKRSENLLNNAKSWNNWKKEMQLQDLLNCNSKDFYTILLNEINARYSKANQNNATFQFMHDINKEIEAQNELLKILKTLKTIYLIKLFHVKDDYILTLNNNQNKLIYLKNLIISNQKS